MSYIATPGQPLPPVAYLSNSAHNLVRRQLELTKRAGDLLAAARTAVDNGELTEEQYSKLAKILSVVQS